MRLPTVVRAPRGLTLVLLAGMASGLLTTPGNTQQATPAMPRAQQQQRPIQQEQQGVRRSAGRRPPATPPRALTPAEQHMHAVEGGLIPAVRVSGKPAPVLTLAARMKKYNVQGVSIAVINDYEIEWVKSYGLADAASKTAVDSGTLFQVGGAGYPVTALAALRVTQARKLDLDRDVNKMLKSWQLPKSELTKKRPVTTRALLAHTAGLTAGAAAGYDHGAPLPSLPQILYGTPPAVTKAVNSVEAPGESIRLSAANYSVVQQLLEDITKRPFANFATDSVLAPLGMTHSTFAQPAAGAATGHEAGGKPIGGKWRVYPEAAAAGLWSTPGDLARVVLEIQQASAGRPGRVLGTEAARQILAAEHVGWPGLGVMLEGRDESVRFRAGGRTAGFEAELVGYVERGQGAIVMTNTSESGALIDEILYAIAREYKWPGFVPPEKVIAKVDPTVYDRFVGRYSIDSREISVARKGSRLFIGPRGKETTELFPESVSDFFTPEPGAHYSFVFDENGKVLAFTHRQRDTQVRWDRKS